jgi:hypothetical protein
MNNLMINDGSIEKEFGKTTRNSIANKTVTQFYEMNLFNKYEPKLRGVKSAHKLKPPAQNQSEIYRKPILERQNVRGKSAAPGRRVKQDFFVGSKLDLDKSKPEIVEVNDKLIKTIDEMLE